MARQRVAVVVVLHEGRVLVGRRSGEQPLAGFWEFPGGRVVPGETPRAAAVRECREETGLAVCIGPRLMTVSHDYAHASVDVHFYCGAPAARPAAPLPPFRWVPVRSLGELVFPPANAPVLRWLLDQFESGRKAPSADGKNGV